MKSTYILDRYIAGTSPVLLIASFARFLEEPPHCTTRTRAEIRAVGGGTARVFAPRCHVSVTYMHNREANSTWITHPVWHMHESSRKDLHLHAARTPCTVDVMVAIRTCFSTKAVDAGEFGVLAVSVVIFPASGTIGAAWYPRHQQRHVAKGCRNNQCHLYKIQFHGVTYV